MKANLEAKGKAYTRNQEMCYKDSYVIIRNSELLAGMLDKGHLGSGAKGGNIFYVILRDFGQEYAIRSMSRLGNLMLYKNFWQFYQMIGYISAKLASSFLMNHGFSIGIGDVTPGENLVKRKNRLLSEG